MNGARTVNLPDIIFETVAFGREGSSSVEPPPVSPSRSDMVVRLREAQHSFATVQSPQVLSNHHESCKILTQAKYVRRTDIDISPTQSIQNRSCKNLLANPLLFALSGVGNIRDFWSVPTVI